MKRLGKIMHRLDLQLSFLVGGIVVLWFVSFLVSANLLNKEREEKNTLLEKERIKLKVDGEVTNLINDLLLDHRKSIELTLQDIYQSLGLTAIELRPKGKQPIRYGNTKTDGSHYVLQQKFPLKFDGREFGTLLIGKELWIMSGSEAVPMKWIVGIAAAMLVIFYMIRLFIQKQIVRPLNHLIQAFGEGKMDQVLAYRSHSFEMDEVLQKFQEMRAKLNEYQTKNIEIERQAALGELAAQVAHDIRSPLTALSVVNEDLSELPEAKRALVRSAVSRIRDIANNLLQKKNSPSLDKKDDEAISIQPIARTVEFILSEKRLQYKNKIGVELVSEFSETANRLFSKVQTSALKRVLSNIIDNAVEALSGAGQVRVWLSARNGAITLRIVDNGKGISPEVQEKLFSKGATFGKPGGSGLGLFYAKEKIAEWGGRISLESIEGKGTSVTLMLPEAEKPHWLVDKLEISKNSIIGILDDDPSIHLTWKKRFSESSIGEKKLVHFSTPEELAAWTRNPENKAELFLVDYEMHSHVLNGLDVIESLGIEKKSILVTSHTDEAHILGRCQQLGVPLLPKTIADTVPVSAC